MDMLFACMPDFAAFIDLRRFTAAAASIFFELRCCCLLFYVLLLQPSSSAAIRHAYATALLPGRAAAFAITPL